MSSTYNDAVVRLNGVLTTDRSTTATYIDVNGNLATAGINELRMNEKGALIEGESTNLMLNSNRMNTPQAVSTDITYNTGTLPNGDNYHTSNYQATAAGRVYQLITSQIVEEGTYTFSIMLWCASGEETLRLAGYDKGSYIIGNDFTIDTIPRFYQFTFETTLDGAQYVAIYNDSAGTAKTINWCNAQVEKLPFASSYIPTLTLPITRGADNVSIPFEDNMDLTNYTVSSEVELLSAPSVYEGDDRRKHIYNLVNLDFNSMFIFVDTLQVLGSYNEATLGGSSNSVGLISTCTVTRSPESLKTYLNGVLGATVVENPNPFPSSPTTAINIGRLSNSRYLWGYLKDFKIFDVALSADDISML